MNRHRWRDRRYRGAGDLVRNRLWRSAGDGGILGELFLEPGETRPGGSLLPRHRRAKGKAMSKVDDLKTEIERLPSEEFTELVRWLSEMDWERWDKEIEADSKTGKLDFLVREALDAKAKGTLKDL